VIQLEDPTRKDIHEINRRIEETEKSVGLLLRASRSAVLSELMENCFRKSIEKARVFLSIDGELSISQIADKLKIKPPNVSRHISDFLDNDLIRLKNTDGSKLIYEKTSQARRLRLDRYLRDTFKEDLKPFEAIPVQVESLSKEGTSESPNPIPSP
jgi:DNA-binding transcriptional ArsR family regulator